MSTIPGPHTEAPVQNRLDWFVPAVILITLFSSLALAQSDNANADSAKIAKKLTKLNRIDHIIVVYQENWSFDALYGNFPGANGLLNALALNHPQLDASNNPLTSVPQPINNGAPDPRFNGITLPVGP